MRIALVAIVVAGCRINFDPVALPDATGRTTDAIDAFCAQPTTLLCDDFSAMPNANLFSGAQWQPNGGRTGGGLLVSVTPDVGAGALYTLPSVRTSGELHARAYVNVHAGPPIQGYDVMIELNNGMDATGFNKVSADIETNDLYGIGAPFTGIGAVGTTAVVRGSWVCVELTVVISATAGEMRVSVGGTEVASRTGVNTQIPSGFNTALVTANVSAGDPPITVEYDDLIVATVPIGC